MKGTAKDLSKKVIEQGSGRIQVTEAVNIEGKPLKVELLTKGIIKGVVGIKANVVDNGNFKDIELYFRESETDLEQSIFSSNKIPEDDFLMNFDSSTLESGKDYELVLVVHDLDGNSWKDVSFVTPLNVFLDINESEFFMKKERVAIKGTAFSGSMNKYEISYNNYGETEESTIAIDLVNDGRNSVIEGTLGYFDFRKVDNGFYNLTLKVYSGDGTSMYSRIVMYEPNSVKRGLPIGEVQSIFGSPVVVHEPIISDVNSDGKAELVVSSFDIKDEKNRVFLYDINGKVDSWPYESVIEGCPNFVTTYRLLDSIPILINNMIVISDSCGLTFLNNDGEVSESFEYPFETRPNYISYANGKIGIRDRFSNSFRFMSLEGVETSRILFNEDVPNSPHFYGDFNGNGELDIATISWDNLLIFESDGDLLLKKAVSGGNFISADVNLDRKQEIIFSEDGTIHVWNETGDELFGWPVVSSSISVGSLSVGNLLGDEELEIISYNSYGKIGIFDSGGKLVREIPLNMRSEYVYVSTYDFDDDGYHELIYVDNIGIGRDLFEPLYVIKVVGLGSSLEEEFVLGNRRIDTHLGKYHPIVNDFSGGGKAEIALTYYPFIKGDRHVYTDFVATDYSFKEENIGWQMFGHDAQHTGCYDCVQAEVIDNRIYHSADNNTDGRIEINEVTAYGSANGQKNSNFSSASYIWKNGEVYDDRNIGVVGENNYMVFVPSSLIGKAFSCSVEQLKGDLDNSKVYDNYDLDLINSYFAGVFEMNNPICMDVNGNGELGVSDVVELKNLIAESGKKPLICGNYGDVNNDTRIGEDDKELIRKAVLREIEFTNEQNKSADVNNDGNVSTLDIAYIRRYLNDEIDTFPVCAILLECTDTDRFDINTFGKVTDKGVEYNDECVGDRNVKEYTCSASLLGIIGKKEVKSTIKECQVRCDSGKCVEQDVNIQRACVDDDVNNDLTRYGKVFYQGQEYGDKCAESGLSVKQYFCADDTLRNFVKRCANGMRCGNGICA